MDPYDLLMLFGQAFLPVLVVIALVVYHLVPESRSTEEPTSKAPVRVHLRTVRRRTRNTRQFLRALSKRYVLLAEEFVEHSRLWAPYKERLQLLCGKKESSVVRQLVAYRLRLDRMILKAVREEAPLSDGPLAQHTTIEMLETQRQEVNELLYAIYRFVHENLTDAINVNARYLVNQKEAADLCARIIGQELDALGQQLTSVVDGLASYVATRHEEGPVAEALDEIAILETLKQSLPSVAPVRSRTRTA